MLANIVATNYEAASASEETRKWWTLAAVAFGLFMIMLDNTVVNVALPAMARDLGVGLSELEWIVTGYALSAPRVPAVPEAA